MGDFVQVSSDQLSKGWASNLEIILRLQPRARHRLRRIARERGLTIHQLLREIIAEYVDIEVE